VEYLPHYQSTRRPSRRRAPRYLPIMALTALVLVAVPACGRATSPAHQVKRGGPAWSLEPPEQPSAKRQNDAPFSYQVAAAKIASQGYVISSGPDVSSRGPLRAFVVICRGSADGHCGVIDFFYNNKYTGALTEGHAGKLWVTEYDARIVSQDGRTVVLDLPLSRPEDPLCCPSGGTLVARYIWNGRTVVPVGTAADIAPKPRISPDA
jgi:hypothetical protein